MCLLKNLVSVCKNMFLMDLGSVNYSMNLLCVIMGIVCYCNIYLYFSWNDWIIIVSDDDFFDFVII